MQAIRNNNWKNRVEGEVHDSYSGMSALVTDLLIVVDLRDLGIQSWKYTFDKDNWSKSVMLLSVLSLAVTGANVSRDLVLVAKKTTKYIDKLPETVQSPFVKSLSSAKLSKDEAGKVLTLLKNDWNLPKSVISLCHISRPKELETILDLTTRGKNVSNVMMSFTGRNGLIFYAATPRIFRSGFISIFKRNPRALLGLTKTHFLIHGLKVFDKHGLTSVLMALVFPTFLLSLLPGFVIWSVFLGSMHIRYTRSSGGG